MKALCKFFPLLLLATVLAAPTHARAQDNYGGDPNAQPQPQAQDQGDDQDVSFQTFYDQLGDQGTWVQTDDYGYVWQPPVSDPGWRPYSQGQWAYTDEGWTWVSDEPWGWATYHYGRWANIDGMGWVWVPGYRWAPAWVSWRYGGGYAGWAPLPPETIYGAEYGDPGVNIGIFHFGGDVDISFHIGAGCYNFVPIDQIGAPNVGLVIINPYNNYGIINRTTNITNLNVSHAGGRSNFRGVAAGGPPINDVNAHARQQVPRVQLTAANQPGRSTLQGNSLAVFAPRLNPASVHQARPTNVAQTLNHPTFNRGDSVTKPLAVTAGVQAPAPSADAVRAAQEAQRQAPSHAKIATAKTPFKTQPHAPLTSLQPAMQNQQTAPVSAGGNGVYSSPQHHAAAAPFEGEPVHPDVNQPPTQSHSSPQMYHPQNGQTGPTGNNYHSQSQDNGSTAEPVHHSEYVQPAPAQPQHTQSQGDGWNNAPVHHPQSTQPAAQPQHTQPQDNGWNNAPVHHAQAIQPAPQQPQHTQSQGNGGGNAQRTAPAPDPAPAPAPTPTPAPAAAPAPQPQGGNHPGNGNNPYNRNQQNH